MYRLIPYQGKNHSVNCYDPFRDIEEIEKNFFREGGLAEFKTDIKDNGDSFLLEADLPGFKKEDIHLDLDDKYLTISAERHSEYEDKDKKDNYLRCERSYGSYSRSFNVTEIDTDAIEAKYDNGVLQLKLPKKAKDVPSARQIAIQ